MQKTHLALASLLALLLPASASALVFSEVMYDPDGTDSGREWVEVYNDGPAPVDLTQIVLVEGSTRHKILAATGTPAQLPADAYAVIADKPDLLAADYPGLAFVYDSAFSLANDGEVLRLSLASGSPDIDVASWTGDAGATGGKSWQRSGEAWIAASATPGEENATAEALTLETEGEIPPAASVPSAHAATVGLSTYEPKQALSVSAGRRRVVPPRVPITIEPAASFKGRLSFRWSWGDGSSSRGKVGEHAYRLPGEYPVVLYVRGSDGASAVSRTTVTVQEPALEVSSVAGKDGYVAVANRGSAELNLGGFELRRADGKRFSLAEDTIVPPGEVLRVTVDLLGFEVGAGKGVTLRYPDGSVAVGEADSA